MTPEAVVTLDDTTCAALLPERSPKAHKGTFGRVIVVAGSLEYAGAGLLVSAAAARTGAGLVTLAVGASLQPVVAGRILEVTTLGLPEMHPGLIDPPAALAVLDELDADALVVGPGLRTDRETDTLVGGLIRLHSGNGRAGGAPAVFDAEALNALSRRPGWWDKPNRHAVLTPHPGEFARLCDGDSTLAQRARPETDAERAEATRAAAARWGQVVVLKGARTVIASPEGGVAVAPFENPALATAGSGDVLSGAIGALLAQGLSTWDAARLGVYLHGMAGNAVREVLGDSGAVAPDLLPQLPLAWRRLAATKGRGKGRLGFGAVSEARG